MNKIQSDIFIYQLLFLDFSKISIYIINICILTCKYICIYINIFLIIQKENFQNEIFIYESYNIFWKYWIPLIIIKHRIMLKCVILNIYPIHVIINKFYK